MIDYFNTLGTNTQVMYLAKSINIDAAHNRKKKNITMDYIKESVADYFNISKSYLIEDTRKRESCQPRQICMFFGSTLGRINDEKIGISFGKDRSTVIHAKKTIKNLIDTDKKFKRQIKEITLKYFDR